MILIGETETVEPDETALVQDDFEDNIHHLTFYIPKGEKGEVGLRGPKGDPYGIGAYGERFSSTTQRFNVTANQETIVPLEQNGSAIFMDYDSSYALHIKYYGVYQINYFLNIATSVDVNYTVSIRASGTKLPGSEIKGEGKANTISSVSGTLIYSLIEDDEITLVTKTDSNAELIFDGTTNAKLSAIKLN